MSEKKGSVWKKNNNNGGERGKKMGGKGNETNIREH